MSDTKETINKITRFISLAATAFTYIFLAIIDKRFKYFCFFTNWGMLLTAIYFLLASLSYYFNTKSLQYKQFLASWAFNWSITLVYWTYLFPVEGTSTPVKSSITHSMPLILTLIEFSQYPISVNRRDFIFPIGLLLGYLGLVLLPYTLLVGPLYTGVTFHNAISYILCSGIILISYIFLELLKLSKDHMHKSYQSDLKLTLIS